MVDVVSVSYPPVSLIPRSMVDNLESIIVEFAWTTENSPTPPQPHTNIISHRPLTKNYLSLRGGQLIL